MVNTKDYKSYLDRVKIDALEDLYKMLLEQTKDLDMLKCNKIYLTLNWIGTYTNKKGMIARDERMISTKSINIMERRLAFWKEDNEKES